MVAIQGLNTMKMVLCDLLMSHNPSWVEGHTFEQHSDSDLISPVEFTGRSRGLGKKMADTCKGNML